MSLDLFELKFNFMKFVRTWYSEANSIHIYNRSNMHSQLYMFWYQQLTVDVMLLAIVAVSCGAKSLSENLRHGRLDGTVFLIPLH